MSNAAKTQVPQFQIIMKNVDPAIVNRSLKVIGIKPTDDFEANVKALRDHQVASTDDPLICEQCKGPSTSEFEKCPYCGAGDDAAADDLVHPENPKVEPALSEKAAKPEKKESKAAKPKAEKASPKKELAKAPAHPAQVVDPKTEISEPALDEAVGRVRKIQNDGALCFYDLGQELSRIYELRLYTQRRDDKGKPKYASWDAFLKEELQMSKQHAFNAIDVAKNFTREVFLEVGGTKLALIAKVSPEARDELVEKAKKGVPLSQMSEDVKALISSGKGAKSGRKDPLGDKRGKGNASKASRPSAPAPKLAADELTAIVTRERIKVKLYARPKPNSKEKPARAMKVQQDPSGSYELPNGVMMHVRVVLEANGLVSIVEFQPPATDKK